MHLLDTLKNRARAHRKHIVLPEGEDPRVQAAAAKITAEGFAKITLLGRPAIIEAGAQKPAFRCMASRSRIPATARASIPTRKFSTNAAAREAQHRMKRKPLRAPHFISRI